MNKFTLTLDSHQLDSASLCLQKYKYSSIEHIKPKRQKAALTKGSIWTHIMQLYYTGIQRKYPKDKLVKIIHRWIPHYSNIDFKDKKGNEVLGVIDIQNRFLEYVIQYYDKDINQQIIAIEKGFSRILYEDDHYLFVYEGRPDMVLKLNGSYVPFDHKTQHPKFAYDHVSMNNQFIGYVWACASHNLITNYMVWSKTPDCGTDTQQMRDHFKKTFRRVIYSYSRSTLDEWRQQTIEQYRRISDAILKDKFPKTIAACDGKYGECFFASLCKEGQNQIVQILKTRDFEVGVPWQAW